MCGCETAIDALLAEVAAVVAHLFGGLLIHIGVAGLDQMFGCAVHEVKIIAGLVGLVLAWSIAYLRPVKTQPLHRVDDAVDVLKLFFFGIGVVKAQVADAAIFTRQPKIEANAFGMADMQIAIGLRWETQAHPGRVRLTGRMVGCVSGAAAPAPSCVCAFSKVFFDDLA